MNMQIPLHHIAATLAAAPAGADAAAAEAALQTKSVWDFAVSGGIMMIPIGIASLVAFSVLVERLISLRRKKIIPPDFIEGLQRGLAASGGDPAQAIAYCRRDGSPVSNVFAAGLKRAAGPIEGVERQIQEAGQREVLKLRSHLRVLSVIAAVAPLMGLLGTILGMISAFETVATSADALGKTELLAGGIYEAMITTAAGLVVAIPALIFYHWLLARVQRLVMDIDELTMLFIEDLHDDTHAEPGSRTATASETTSAELVGRHAAAPTPPAPPAPPADDPPVTADLATS